MKAQIERGIPLPATGGSSGWREVLDAMQIGDSFLVPEGKLYGVRNRASAMGLKITCRKAPLDPGNYRVWLVSRGEPSE